MKGYKALDMEMRAIYGNGMQYKMGKLYSVEGEVVPCENGFHFCKSIETLNSCYSIKNSRIFEVEADGEIEEHYGKYVAEKIMLIRELTKEEIRNYFKQNQKEFIKSEYWFVRCAAAELGYGLEELINDESLNIRIAIAEQGYGLAKLIHDKNPNVRRAVAKQNYGLEVLVNDADRSVREAARTAMNRGNKR